MAWPRAARCWAWVAVSCLLRALFARLNARAFRGWFCPLRPLYPTVHTTTGIEVIVPSLPTTGSTTLQVALEALGLRAYKGDELLFYLPGVLDPELPPHRLVEPFRACGVKAFVGDDTYGLVPKLLSVSPDAKVLLTARSWRQWREAWTRARRGPEEKLFELLALLLCDWLPLGAIWADGDVGHSFVKDSFSTMMLQNCLMEGRRARLPAGASQLMLPHSQLFHNESFYDEWLRMLRNLVPPDRFMEFDFGKHGWRELAQFLGRPAPAAPAELPRTMGGTTSNDVLKLQLFPLRWLAFWAIMLVSALLHCLALRQVARLPCFVADHADSGQAPAKKQH